MFTVGIVRHTYVGHTDLIIVYLSVSMSQGYIRKIIESEKRILIMFCDTLLFT